MLLLHPLLRCSAPESRLPQHIRYRAVFPYVCNAYTSVTNLPLSLYLSLSIYLSLSLYVYIYIYIYLYTHITPSRDAPARDATSRTAIMITIITINVIIIIIITIITIITNIITTIIIITIVVVIIIHATSRTARPRAAPRSRDRGPSGERGVVDLRENQKYKRKPKKTKRTFGKTKQNKVFKGFRPTSFGCRRCYGRR